MRVTCRTAGRRNNVLIVMFVLGAAVRAGAQVPAPADAPAPVVTLNEDIEPRVIGTPGSMSVGIGGYGDQVRSDETRPFNLTLHVDVTRFLTAKIAVRGGMAGSLTIGGDTDALPTGVGMPGLNAFGEGLYYFTPRSIASLYAGAGYWSQITARGTNADRGAVLGVGGVEAALSSRATVFVEGGWGVGLTRTDDDGLRKRVMGRIGVRLKL